MMRLISSLFAVVLAVQSASAQLRASEPVRLPEAQVRLLAVREAEGRLVGGVEITLAAGYKTYWKNPGDSGVAPAFDFSASTGVGPLVPRFPFPARFDDGAGGMAFGYVNHVIFPFETQAGPEAQLRLKLDFAVCGTLCIPLAAELALDPDKGASAPEDVVRALATMRAALPRPVPASAQVQRTGPEGFTLLLPYAGPLAGLQVFPEAPAFFEIKAMAPAGEGQVRLTLQAQPQPGKSRLGPLSLTYGHPDASFEQVLDVDGAR